MVVGGSLWVGSDHMASKQVGGVGGGRGRVRWRKCAVGVTRPHGEQHPPAQPRPPCLCLLCGVQAVALANESVDITAQSAFMFVIMASCMLVILFFFLNKVFFYVLVGGWVHGLCTVPSTALFALLTPSRVPQLPEVEHPRAFFFCLPASNDQMETTIDQSSSSTEPSPSPSEPCLATWRAAVPASALPQPKR